MAQERHGPLWHAMKRKYGITPDQYIGIYWEQGGRCAICQARLQRLQIDGGDVTDPGRRAALDHDHETDKIRGLLCTQCNAGLGMFQDSPRILANAIAYLLEYGKTL